MSAFSDEARVGDAVRRLQDKVLRPLRPWIDERFQGSAVADDAAIRFVNVLDRLSSPAAVIDLLQASPILAQTLARLVTLSRSFTDVLVQNPELVDVMLDPDFLLHPPTVGQIRAEVQRLMGATGSYAHQLDRLRFVRQRHMVRLAALDVGDLVPQPEVWRGLSHLADALLMEARDLVWRQIRARAEGVGKILPEVCPVTVAVFGKQGGHELNFFSDVDLLFVLRDDADEETEKWALRWAEGYRAALADRMGRGDLYRVDLRLRPFGRTGPLLSRMRNLEAYYERYAEPWEHLALIRTRLLDPAAELDARWEELRRRTIFRGARSEAVLEGLHALRSRTESFGDVNDLKRGRGGIRDIEFLVQTLQMLLGDREPGLTVKPTLDALDALGAFGALPSDAVQSLKNDLIRLRTLEHRAQILDGQQTHQLPGDAAAKAAIAQSVGLTRDELDHDLSELRNRVRGWYEQLFPFAAPPEAAWSQAIEAWVQALPAPGTRQVLVSNPESLSRLQALEKFAPRLLEISRGLPGLAERLLSGEVLEPMRLTRADPDLVRSAWWGAVAAGILESEGPALGQRLSDVADAVAQATWSFDPAHSAVIALGSWGAQDLLTTSDLDALVWFDADVPTDAAEAAVTQWLKAWSDLPMKVDLRLRPEGRFGRLATRASALELYAAQHLEPWERFALGRSRLVVGSPAGLGQVRALAYPGAWAAEMRAHLGHMKLRIERERAAGASDLKLGPGGSDDFAWLLGVALIHLGAEAQEVAADAASRLAALVQAGLFSGSTARELLVAHHRGQAVRQWRAVSEDPDESWPPAPAKLEALAEWQGFDSVPSLLKSHAEDRARIRAEWEAMRAKVLT